MIHYITYSNELYSNTRDYSVLMAKKYGRVDTVTSYKPEDIDEIFFEEHKDILSVKTGNGLWLWKPYFLDKKLSEVNEGDYVIYCDAASFFIKPCKVLIDSMSDSDIWLSNIPLIEKQFTKPELFNYMNCNFPEYTDTNQIQANFIIVRKSKKSVEFIKEWLKLCSKKELITRDTYYSKQSPDFYFICHRSDQSILSLLAKKYKIPTHLDPTQYGRVPEKYYAKDRIFKIPDHSEAYRPCIILHRKQKIETLTVFNQWVFTWFPKRLIPIISTPVRNYKKLEKTKNK